MKLIFLLCAFFGAAGLCCASPVGGWESYRFDGIAFTKGTGTAAILVRDGYLPVPEGVGSPTEDKLPADTGAVAVFCFQQSAPGKFRRKAAVARLPGVAIALAGKNGSVVGRTDAGGYLVLGLPEGSYQVSFRGFVKKVTVERGKTALVALRGGKRMVD
jgi:hypothetical protein